MRFFVVAALSLVAFGILAYHAAADDRPVVKIGATLPLTGSLAYIGEDIRRGMSLALDEEKNGPVRFEVLFDDNQYLGKKAVSSAQKLLEGDKADVLVSLWDMADVVAPLAERQKIPHVSIRWNPHIAEKYSYTFTFESTYISYVRSQLRLLKALNVKTVSLATEEGQGWILAAKEFRRLSGEFGIEILAEETFQADTQDFQSIVTKLLAKNPQMIVTSMLQPGLDLFLKKVRDQRPTQGVTGYFESVTPPSLVANMPFVAQYAAAPAFSKLFSDTYGEPFKARAPHGYDIVKMIARVYSEAGEKMVPAEFVRRLSNLKDYAGATGMLASNTTKNIENEPVWSIYDGKEFALLTPEKIASYRFSK